MARGGALEALDVVLEESVLDMSRCGWGLGPGGASHPERQPLGTIARQLQHAHDLPCQQRVVHDQACHVSISCLRGAGGGGAGGGGGGDYVEDGDDHDPGVAVAARGEQGEEEEEVQEEAVWRSRRGLSGNV